MVGTTTIMKNKLKKLAVGLVLIALYLIASTLEYNDVVALEQHIKELSK